ncbi:MAG TPA: hypothetical protein VGM91_17380 [Conexibacter sp.]|jgi:hypothetical protein
MSEREPHQIPAEQDASGEPHDVLAAEEFPGPSPGEAIHGTEPVELPADPSGADAPAHDVLAAEEFAMPAPRHSHDVAPVEPAGSGSSRKPFVAGVAALLLGALTFTLTRRAKRRRVAS